MHGLVGEIHISEEAHERRQNPARFRSVKSLNGPAELFGYRRHLRQTTKRSGSRQLRSDFPTPTIQWLATALIDCGLQLFTANPCAYMLDSRWLFGASKIDCKREGKQNE